MIFYAMADIHGYLDKLQERINLLEETLDFYNSNDKLILIGDYIDRGDYSIETLYYIKSLIEKYPNKIIALKGNHEAQFLCDLVNNPHDSHKTPYNLEKYIDLIEWLKQLPDYLETDNQIYSHFGVDEDLGIDWKNSKDFFNNKTVRTGHFYKTVIAGHLPTSFMANNPNYYDIYYDGDSHYYIDG